MCVLEWCFGLFCLCKVKKDFILSALIIADNSTAYSKYYYKQELVLLPVYNWHQVLKDNVISLQLSCTVPEFNFFFVKQIQDKHEKTADISQCHHNNAEIPY